MALDSVTPVVTVATPVTTTSDVLLQLFLLKTYQSLFKPPNLSKLPTFNLPGNSGFELVIVLIETDPLPVADICGSPKLNKSL